MKKILLIAFLLLLAKPAFSLTTQDIVISALVQNSCTLSTPTVNSTTGFSTPQALGQSLLSAAGTAQNIIGINVILNINCTGPGSKLTIKSLNAGHFNSTTITPQVTVPYGLNVAIGGVTYPFANWYSTNSGNISAAVTNMVVPSGPQSTTLTLTPVSTASVPSDTYTDTITIALTGT